MEGLNIEVMHGDPVMAGIAHGDESLVLEFELRSNFASFLFNHRNR